MATSLKFRFQEEEELYFPCKENKGADQMYSYCTTICCVVTAQPICAYAKSGFLMMRLIIIMMDKTIRFKWVINPFMDFPIVYWVIPLSSLGPLGVIFKFYSIFNEISLSKQNSPKWDAAFCGVASGAILFAFVH